MKRVIVAGSRTINDYALVGTKLNECFANWSTDQVEIVSGGARGVDRLGERFAKEYNLPCKVFPADWNTYGKSAGYKRNVQMAEYATHLVAFWDGQSRGTKHMIDIAEKKGMPIRVIDATGTVLKKEKPKAKKNKFTEYAIIDHVGSVNESVLKRVYDKAFGMIENGLTAYTMKKFCLTINPNVRNLDSMKNSMRMSKNPKQIVLIVGADNMNSPYSQKNTPIGTSTSQWVSKEWLERCNNVTILQVIEDRIYEYSAEDIDPTLFKLFEPTNSIERQYAAIWGPALDYHFSAPLYKDDFYAMKEESLKRAGYAPESGSYSCKRTTRPEKYRVTKQIASEKEVRTFYYDYYLYFKKTGTLEENLSPDYKICPHCGNPVNINAPECTCHHENPYYVGLEFSSYYDTEEIDEEDFLDDFEEKEEIFDIDEF